MPDSDKPSLDELRARASAALADLQAAESDAATPILSLADAQARLQNAAAALELAERPYWDREHARHALATARTHLEKVEADLAAAPPHLVDATRQLRDAAAAAIPGLEQAHAAAVAAHEAHTAAGVTAAHIDAAAQLVIEARAALDRATTEAGGNDDAA